MNVEQDAHPTFSVHDPVNVGNPQEFNMLELAAEIARAVGAELRTRNCPLPADDPRQRRPDITRAKALLDWSPTIPIREGIDRTVAYFVQRNEFQLKNV
jgi:nucleoside-diphosphate-sugar epimerase